MSRHTDQGIVSVRLDGDLYRLLCEQAYAFQVSHAAIVRQALAAYLTRPEVSPGRSWELDADEVRESGEKPA